MRLYLMRVGTVGRTGAPVPVYLIETDDGQRVLVDTGYARDRAGAYRTDPTEPIRLDAWDTVESQLAAIGVDPGSIDYVVCSHFDLDHAGNHDLFAQAEFIVQSKHLRYARDAGRDRTGAGKASWDQPGLRYREVSGDTTLLPGVELIESSGHVVGHQSVLVRFVDAPPVLLAIDAIPTVPALDAQRRPIYPFDLDEAQVRASTGRLVALARAENARLICGHDADQWRSLRVAPDYYA
jgi:N-acyl homoserine lactone hydrolase